MNNINDFMKPEVAAEYLCVSVRSLNKWRSTGEHNVPYRKLGKSVLYSRADLDAYLAKHSYNSVEG